jgi:hypothetical protein
VELVQFVKIGYIYLLTVSYFVLCIVYMYHSVRVLFFGFEAHSGLCSNRSYDIHSDACHTQLLKAKSFPVVFYIPLLCLGMSPEQYHIVYMYLCFVCTNVGYLDCMINKLGFASWQGAELFLCPLYSQPTEPPV